MAQEAPAAVAPAPQEAQPAEPLLHEQVQTPVEQPTEQKPVEQTDHEKLLAGIDDVLKKTKEEPTAPDKPAEQDKPAEGAAAPAGEKPAETPTPAPAVADADKDDDKLAFKDHPRFKALRDEAIASRARLKEYEAQIAPLQEQATHHQNLQSFVQQSGMSGDEFAELLLIGQLMKSDPFQAAKLLKPHMDRLALVTGEGELSENLKRRVTDGEISEAAARELQRSQSAAAAAAQRASQLTSEQIREREAIAAQQAMAEKQNAIASWEAQVKAKDPRYAEKQELMVQFIRSEAAVTPPRNAQESIALAERCYAKVNKYFTAPAVTPKPATRAAPSTASASQARVVVAPKPKSLLDGVDQVLSGMRG